MDSTELGFAYFSALDSIQRFFTDDGDGDGRLIVDRWIDHCAPSTGLPAPTGLTSHVRAWLSRADDRSFLADHAGRHEVTEVVNRGWEALREDPLTPDPSWEECFPQLDDGGARFHVLTFWTSPLTGISAHQSRRRLDLALTSLHRSVVAVLEAFLRERTWPGALPAIELPDSVSAEFLSYEELNGSLVVTYRGHSMTRTATLSVQVR